VEAAEASVEEEDLLQEAKYSLRAREKCCEHATR
jgi:hypothetical protein